MVSLGVDDGEVYLICGGGRGVASRVGPRQRQRRRPEASGTKSTRRMVGCAERVSNFKLKIWNFKWAALCRASRAVTRARKFEERNCVEAKLGDFMFGYVGAG